MLRQGHFLTLKIFLSFSWYLVIFNWCCYSSTKLLIIVLIFQVYTAQRADYAGGSLFGVESGEPTRTLLTFMINSIGGKYEDIVCFVPVTSLDWQTLLHHFMKVMSALQGIGFETMLTITDGHHTNVRFFTEISGGLLKVKISHPVAEGEKLFLLFDPIHLFKNFFNNFLKRRYRKLNIV